MYKKLGFGWEVVVDDVVEHGDINTAGLGTKICEYWTE